MTTLTIELPDDTARLATEKARRAHMTLAEWVRVRIAGRRRATGAADRDALGYPVGWIERTCGSLGDVEDFREMADPALAHGATLVTNNTAEVSRVPGLTIEDWTLP